MAEREIERELEGENIMDFEDLAELPELEGGALPPAEIEPRANLNAAIRRGVNVMINGADADRPRREADLVNFDSSEDEEDQAPPDIEAIDVGRQSEAHRRATQVSTQRAEQDTYKSELSAGCDPLRFAEILPRFDSIRNQCLRDSVANRYIERVQDVARSLAKINESLQGELDPVS